MTAVCEAFGVARSNMAERVRQRPSKARGRPPFADDDLVHDIKAIISEMSTYVYRRVHALLRRKARSESRSWPNVKRVYRVMKVHGLLLERHTGAIDSRRHDGRVAVAQSNLRWCSDGSKSAAITKKRSALPLRSTAVIARQLPMSPLLKTSKAKMFRTLSSRPSKTASAASIFFLSPSNG